MKSSTESKRNIFFWVLIVLLLVVGCAVNSYLDNVSGALRFVGWIVLLCVLIFFFSRTYSGKKFFQFLRLSRMEIRKVVYPKRQEVVRNTALIIFLVLSISVIMWLADLFFIWAIGFFTLG